MSTPTLTNTISQKLISLDFPRIDLRFLWVLGFLGIGFLLVFYIFQVNQATQGSFLTSYYEEKIAEISQQNKNLESYFSQNNSLASLETLLLNSGYEKIDKVHYIQTLSSSVAYEELAD